VVVPLCGGNIDSTVLGRCIDRGLAADGRLCRFIVTVSDRPGGIADLSRLLCSLGARFVQIMSLKIRVMAKAVYLFITRHYTFRVQYGHFRVQIWDRITWVRAQPV
jgi:hypothetical protein